MEISCPIQPFHRSQIKLRYGVMIWAWASMFTSFCDRLVFPCDVHPSTTQLVECLLALPQQWIPSPIGRNDNSHWTPIPQSLPCQNRVFFIHVVCICKASKFMQSHLAWGSAAALSTHLQCCILSTSHKKSSSSSSKGREISHGEI